MDVKTKYNLEYVFNVSPKVLYNRISTAGGLSEWFADEVEMNENVFKFSWDKTFEEAKLISKKENKCVRFQWLSENKNSTFFEFRINVEELTGDVALLITDFAFEDEVEDSKNLWDMHIADLKRTLGI
jgi:hypothetical protein